MLGVANEAFRLLQLCIAERAFAEIRDTSGAVRINIVEGEHRDPGVAMLEVVPGERTKGRTRSRHRYPRSSRGSRNVLQDIEQRLAEEAVGTDKGQAEHTVGPETGLQLRGALACHECTAILMPGKHPRLDCGDFLLSDHPPNDVEAEDAERT